MYINLLLTAALAPTQYPSLSVTETPPNTDPLLMRSIEMNDDSAFPEIRLD